MKKSFIVLLLLSQLSSFCQNDRYRFAESFFGFESEFVSEKNSFSYYDSQNQIQRGRIASSITPRILIGGTHFWGHADFYISIPLSTIKINGNKNLSSTNGVFTGFRVLPWKLKDKGFRPYFGAGFNSKKIELNNGPTYTNWQWYYEWGLNFRHKNRIVGLEMRYFSKNLYNAAIARTEKESLSVSPYSFSISYKQVIDFTAGYSTERSKKHMKAVYEKAKEEKALSAFSFGLGLTALIPLKNTELASQKPFFNDEIEGSVNIDLGIAYYINPIDASIRFSYRPLKQEETAFDYTYKLNKQSFALDAFKFIGDYHGFAPFIGPYVSFDRYHLTEIDDVVTIQDQTFNRIGYGLVFGWDIRQTKVDYITLRTNLRYTPEYNYTAGGYRFTAEQLEFNFIQLVYYPERHKIYKQNK
ncbi:MAG: hypothetical protein HND54_02355 [Bacteroidetes bacterium]|nr:hypothetical protein [Bacteroidota bacterium]